MLFTKLTCKWAIENPIGIMSTKYRKPDQIIQPWMFGHGETKATCLWLNGLPKLKSTNIVEGREGRIWKMPLSIFFSILFPIESKNYFLNVDNFPNIYLENQTFVYIFVLQ